MYKTLKATYDRSQAQKHTYVRCVLKKKSVLLAIDMRLTSLALMFLFFFEFASLSPEERCVFGTKSKTIENGGHNWSLVFVSFSSDQH